VTNETEESKQKSLRHLRGKGPAKNETKATVTKVKVWRVSWKGRGGSPSRLMIRLHTREKSARLKITVHLEVVSERRNGLERDCKSARYKGSLRKFSQVFGRVVKVHSAAEGGKANA